MRGLGRLSLVVASLAIVSACQQQPTDQSGAAAEAVRAADIAWEQVFSRGDVEASLAFMDSAGSILAANNPIATGHEAARAIMEEFHKTPGMTFHWHVTGASASRSGDLGYTTGTYDATFTGADGKPATDKGKYVTVWRKHPDGSWKVLLDMLNSDLPPHGAGG